MTSWCDAHLDLAYIALNGRDLTAPMNDADEGCVELPALRDANVDLVFATIFTEPVDAGGDFGEPSAYIRDDVDDAHRVGVRQLDVYRALESRRELTIVRSWSDLLSGALDDAAAPRCIILMEGADPIRSPDEVTWWAEQGVGIVGLTWARGTRYAGGNASHGPLTDAGRDLVEALDAHHVVHDLSHLSDDAADALLECSVGAIIASHSNARALHDDHDQRHLRDVHIDAIAARAGVIGLNLCAPFIVRHRPPTIDDTLAHVDYIANRMGDRAGVGLGSDMDGGFRPIHLPPDVRHPTQLERLAAGLAERGWTADEVDGFRGRNWRRFLERQVRAIAAP